MRLPDWLFRPAGSGLMSLAQLANQAISESHQARVEVLRMQYGLLDIVRLAQPTPPEETVEIDPTKIDIVAYAIDRVRELRVNYEELLDEQTGRAKS